MQVINRVSDRIKVLIVDHHAVMRDGICALLNSCDDIEVVAVASEVKEGIDKAKSLTPHIIVMELPMPGMDCLEATRRILRRNHKTKVLIFSDYEDREHIISSISAGAAGYLPKTSDGMDLVLAIRTLYNDCGFLLPSAVSSLIREYSRKLRSNPGNGMTNREIDVLKLIAEGFTSREIAVRLGVSPKTIFGHRNKLMKKLSLHNMSQVIRYAIRNGLIEIDA